MAKQKAKKSKEEIASARKTKAIKARHIAFICAEINSKQLPNGRLRRGELAKALKEHKPIIPWITIDLIKKGLKKDSGGGTTTITTTISDLTDSTASDISPTSEVQPNNTPPYPPVTIATGATEASFNGATSKKGGRPHGTQRRRAVNNEIIVCF
jgi:hypothetical protein